MRAEGSGVRSDNQDTPRWLLRFNLYALTAAYVLPFIIGATGATFLLLDRKWLGASVFAVWGGVFAVVGWKRLHGKLSYVKPPPILELRRKLRR